MVQIFGGIEVDFGQMIQQALYGRCQGVCGGRLIVPANGHEEEGDKLEAAI